jgi:hypothetical protein
VRRIALLIALVALLASAAVALGGGKAGPPKRALVTSHGLRTGSVLGSYCSAGQTEAGQGVGGCGDAEYPLHPRTFVPITPRSTVRVNVRKRAKRVTANLEKGRDAPYGFVGDEMKGQPVSGSHHRIWRLRMPDDLPKADALSIDARFADGGDANWWAGVKPVDQWP